MWRQVHPCVANYRHHRSIVRQRDVFAVAVESLVERVAKCLNHEARRHVRSRQRADVHRGPTPDRLQSLQDFDLG